MPDATYTPTTEDVRADFAFPWIGFRNDTAALLAAFDRWLFAHDAEIADKERDRIVAWLTKDTDTYAASDDDVKQDAAAITTLLATAIAANEHREGKP